jgi:8-oxo-dGTP pyrophosphatase MutT (NUDIX family)
MADPKPWIVEGTDPVADCRVFEVEARRSRRADGAEGTFYRLRSVDWVNVIALTGDGRVVLIRQWRHGAATGVLEIPGGMVDAGEDPQRAAQRELLEETGYRAARWAKLGAVNPNPALFGNRLHSFLAEDCELTDERDNDPHEETLVELVERPALDDLMRAGRIDHALVLTAFQWWNLRGP